LEELEALSEMDSYFAAEEVGKGIGFLKSLRELVMSKYGAHGMDPGLPWHPWSQLVKNIRMSPRPGIIGGGHGYSLLHAFAQFRHDAAVQLLLSKGADIDAPDQHGETILCNAIGRCDGDFSLRLLDVGASVRSIRGDITPLHKAVQVGFEHMVKILLERGSDVNRGSPIGDTPLHIAAAGDRQHKIVKLLLDGGADVTLKNHQKKTPLAIATRNNPSGGEVVHLLRSAQPKRRWIF
jgi:ankyrin repeat protein